MPDKAVICKANPEQSCKIPFISNGLMWSELAPGTVLCFP